VKAAERRIERNEQREVSRETGRGGGERREGRHKKRVSTHGGRSS
jgi:hypothetical protein